MNIDSLPRVRLASLPTELEDAPSLAAAIGVGRLLVKRDDNTGLATGGNKARKLEFLMAEALDQGADIVISCGGNQSNHARMTAAAARKLGLDCVLFLTNPMPHEFEGNLLLDTILGARMVFLGDTGMERLAEAMDAEADALRSAGRTPYVIPIGGSTPVGAMGYVTGVSELAGQLRKLGIRNPDIVFAVGSCGTAAGIALGCEMYLPDAGLFGISVSQDAAEIVSRVERIVPAAAELIGAKFSGTTRLTAHDEYIGRAYAVPTPEGKAAILLAARTEGLILDPVYTGKAMAGLIDLARKGVVGKGRPVVFWHTGGSSGLFAHEKLFRDDARELSADL
ncbi:MAG: D-cysteine desulfhydrase family protein [Armatimonadetes bacterium]|nr:D-cysteine desulfhydrase family protein [Armatimonadota bacterium]